jgi:putative tricarboxylic transport membrane protein
MRVNDLISGALLVLLAVVMIGYTTTFPPFPGQKYGPSLFPRILGVGLILCGGLLMLRGWKLQATGQRLGQIDDTYRAQRGWMSVLLMIGAITFYIVFSNILGFVVTGFLVLFTLLWWFGSSVPRAALAALIAVLVIDWFFGWLFRVPLPLGFLPNGPANILMNLVRGVR